MMIRRLLHLFLLMAIGSFSLWLGVQTPAGQRLAKRACVRLMRAAGLCGSVEHVDLLFPIYVRCQGLSIQGPNDTTLLSCEELFFTPALVDLPFKRITFLNVSGRGISFDADAIESTKEGSWSYSILRLRLDSLHVSSRRLPGGEFDGSLRGKFSISGSSHHLSCSLTRKNPSTWPKRLDFRITTHDAQYDARARLYLGTEGLPLFGPKDWLEVSLTADQSLNNATGSWTLTCPKSTSFLRDDLFITQSALCRGSLVYRKETSLLINCDSAEKIFSVEQLMPSLSTIDVDSDLPIQVPTPLYSTTLSARGSLSCAPCGPDRYQAALSLTSCSLNDFLGSVSATIDLSMQEGQVSAAFMGDGHLQRNDHNIPLKGQAAMQSRDGGWMLTADLFAAPFHITADYAVSPQETNGCGLFRCQDVSVLEGLLTAPASGSAELTASIHTDNAGSRLSFSGNLSDFHCLGVECQNGTIRWAQDQASPSLVTCSADMKEARFGPASIEESHAALTYDLNTHALTLLEADARGHIHGLPCNFTASGEGLTTKGEGTLAIDHLQGSFAEYPISLDQPVRLSHKDQRLSSLAGALRIGTEGRIVGEWHRPLPHRLSGDLLFEHLPLARLMTALNGPSAEGTLDGQVHMQINPRAVTANASIQASIARFGVLGGADGGLALGTTVTIEHGEAAIQTCIAGMGMNEPLLVHVRTPITRLAQWPFLFFNPQSPLRGTVKGDIRLTQLLGGWLPDQAGFEAIIGCDAAVSGTIGDPSFRGTARVREGRIDLLPTGEVIKNIEMEGIVDHRTLIFHRIEASDDKEGCIAGTGWIEVSPSNEFRWQAVLNCSNIEAISLDCATASADGTVTLDGGLSGMTISGSAVARKALIDLSARFVADTPEISLTYIGEKPPDPNPFTVAFDLSVDAASGVEIRGRGISSQWKGHLHLGGTAPQLILDGSLHCLEGTFCLSNKSLTITEGSITVAGDLFQDSRLNVIAEIALPTISAEVCLRGSLETPKISIRSTPPRPDTEILSLILFNKEFGDISPLQSLQLANTALSIEHPSGPFGFVDRVKESLGIDLIDVGSQTPTSGSPAVPAALDPSDTGPPPPQLNDVSIKVGKYICDGVAVTVSKIVGSDMNYVGFEAQLAPEVTAEAQVGADQIGVLSLKWKRNY